MLALTGWHLFATNNAVLRSKPARPAGRIYYFRGSVEGPSLREVGDLLPARGRVSKPLCKWRSVMVRRQKGWNFPVWNEFQNSKNFDTAQYCRRVGIVPISRQRTQ